FVEFAHRRSTRSQNFIRGTHHDNPHSSSEELIMTTHTTTMDNLTTETPARKSLARHIPAAARILMGVPLVIFGLNAFLNFIPAPSTPLPAGAAAFAGALFQSGYMM